MIKTKSAMKAMVQWSRSSEGFMDERDKAQRGKRGIIGWKEWCKQKFSQR